MAWFVNHYRCGDCGETWDDEWSCMVDDDCPKCRSRHWTPFESVDLTEIIEPKGDKFVVLRSPDNAEHRPDYRAVAFFHSESAALRFVIDGELI
jgi:hypothetical protein